MDVDAYKNIFQRLEKKISSLSSIHYCHYKAEIEGIEEIMMLRR